VRNNFATLILVAALVGAQPSFLAQEPAAAQKSEAAKPAAPVKGVIIPLKLLITVSRHQGDKKLSSLPYSLSVSIGGQSLTRFRSGAQVPYATTAVNDGVKTPTYSYRDVGVGIDVSGTMIVEPGLYKMEISVNDTSISSSNQIQGAPTISGVPIFRNFSTGGTVLLRDGQTTQLTAAADPITGETMRVDVMLTVVK
jgi:hypothetical protein